MIEVSRVERKKRKIPGLINQEKKECTLGTTTLKTGAEKSATARIRREKTCHQYLHQKTVAGVQGSIERAVAENGGKPWRPAGESTSTCKSKAENSVSIDRRCHRTDAGGDKEKKLSRQLESHLRTRGGKTPNRKT